MKRNTRLAAIFGGVSGTVMMILFVGSLGFLATRPDVTDTWFIVGTNAVVFSVAGFVTWVVRKRA